MMGIETEYGISVPGHPNVNAMLMSSQVVNAYSNQLPTASSRTRWDYDEETRCEMLVVLTCHERMQIHRN